LGRKIEIKMAKSEIVNAGKAGVPGAASSWFSRNWQALRSFYGEVRNEMRRVTSPSWKEVRATTTVVIITVFIFGLFFFAVDGVLRVSLDALIRHLAGR
jgi:preprotein translocase subunit SecE